MAAVAGVKWCILSLVTKRPWSSLKLKLARSLQSPFSLHSLQDRSQSLVGALISVLQGMYFLTDDSATSMVRPSSVLCNELFYPEDHLDDFDNFDNRFELPLNSQIDDRELVFLKNLLRTPET